MMTIISAATNQLLRGRSLLLLFTTLCVQVALAQTGPQLTYHGRIIDGTTGLPVVSASVNFLVQIRSPGVENCLMYEETQTKNLSATQGIFVLNINNGSGTRTDAAHYTMEQVMSNKVPFTLFVGVGECASGTSYTPGATDARRINVFFNDGTFVGWEPLPTQTVAYVPLAVEALNVGGYPANSLLRFVNGGGAPQNVSPLSNANYTELVALVTGASTQYVQAGGNAGGFTGSLGGDVTGTQSATVVSNLRGTPLAATAPTSGQYMIFNGTSWVPQAGSGGTVTNVSSANSYLTVTGGTLAPILTVNVGTIANTVAAGNDSRIVGAFQTATTLSGDLAGTLPGATVATVGGRSAAQIATAVDDTINAVATAANSTLVRRDGTGAASFTTATATNVSTRNIYYYDGTNTNYVHLRAPASFAGSIALTLPTSTGPAGWVLGTDGAGVMAWQSPTSGSVTTVTASAPLASSGGGTPNISISQSTSSANGYLSSSDWTLFNNKMSVGLTTGQVWVGNGSNVAVPRFLNITDIKSSVLGNWMSAAGACAAGQTLTYSAVNDNLECAAYSVTSGQVTTALGFTPASNALSDSNIFVGNSSNVATGVSLSGDATISNTGLLTISNDAITTAKILNGAVTNAKINSLAWSKITSTPNTVSGYGIIDAILTNAGGVDSMQAGTLAARPVAGTANRLYIALDTQEIFHDNGSSWVRVGSSIGLGGTVTNVTANAPLSVLTSSTTPVISMPAATTTVSGYLTSVDWTTFNAKQATALPTGQVWVGNGSNVAAAKNLNITDIKSSVLGNWMSASGACAAGETLTYSSVNDNVECAAYSITTGQVTTALGFTPASNALSSGNIFVGSAGNVAAGVTLSGDATITNAGVLTIGNDAVTTVKIANSAVTNAKINSVAWSKITSTPNTVSGYGIIDAILTNAGGVDSMQAGTFAARPVAGSANRVYISTDTGEIYRDNGGAWVKVGSATGLGGTVTQVTANFPLSIVTSSTTPVVSIPVATNAASGYLTSDDWTIFNSKLTSVLNSTQIFVGSVGNVATAVNLSGDATIANNGVLSLINTGAPAGAYGSAQQVATFTVDAKGRLTSAGIITINDTSKLPLMGGILSGNLNMAATTNVMMGNYTSAAETTLIGSLAAADKGRTWYNSTSNQLKFWDGSAAQTLGVVGAGITSLNGLTAISQTFAVGTAGTALNISSSGSVHTLNVPMASTVGTTAGLISKADYDTFNTKQSTALSANLLWVGNGSNIATPVAMSGDASIISSGVVTLTNSASTRTNLGLGTASTLNVAAVGDALSTQVVKGDDTRLTDSRIPTGSASGDLTGTYPNPTLVTTGVGAGTFGSATQVATFSVDAKGRLTSASQITVNDTSKLPLTGGTLSGNLNMAATSNVMMGNYTSAAQATLVGTLTSSDKGRTWFNTTSNIMMYWDGSSAQSIAASGGVIASLNGQTGYSQTFAIGTTGTAPAFSSGSNIHTLNIPMASSGGTTAGLLSKTDYDIFNNKIGVIVGSPLSSGQMWIGNGSNLAAQVTMSGDATMATTGVLTLANTSTARTNLGLGSVAILNVAAVGDATSVQVVKGDDTRLTDSRTPAGAASGDLTGTYPNPTLVTTGVGAGTFGSATQVATFSVDAKGRLTSASQITVNDTSKLPLTGGTLSGNLNMAATTNVMMGNYTSAAEATMLGSLTSADRGRTWYNTTASTMRFWDGSSVQSLGIAGAGLTSLNGATGSSQTFSVNNGGTFGFTTASNVHTLNIPSASTSVVGLLSSTDWNIFNNKQGTNAELTALSGIGTTGILQRTGAGAYTTLGTTAPLNVTAGNIGLSIAASSSGLITSAGSLEINPGSGLQVNGSNQLVPVFGTSAGTIAQGNDSRFTDSRPPTGAASGDLTGTYPNPTLAVSGVTAATYGSASLIPQFAVDAKGRVTSATTVALNDTSKLPLTGGTLSGNLNMAATTNVMMGNYTSAAEATLVGALTSSDSGRSWFNATMGALRFWDGSGVQSVGVVGGSLSSLNGLTGATQTFATGTAGSDFAISSVGSVHTFNVPNASTSTRGALNSTDWNIFNNKQGTNAELTALSGIGTTGILQRTGAGAYTTLGTTAPLNVTAGNIGISIATSSSGLITSSGSLEINPGSGLQVNGSNQLVPVFGTSAGTIAQGNDSRITGAFQSATSLSGDLTGTLPNPTIATNAVTTAKINDLAVTDAKINSVAWSKITSTPTTLSGYGITNGVTNAGSGAGNIVTSLQSGNTAGLPAFGTDGRLYIDTQAGVIYRDSGSAWVSVATNAGTGLSSLTGDVTTTGSGTVSAAVQTVGGVTSANVAAGATLANNSVSASTVSTVVRRDAAGSASFKGMSLDGSSSGSLGLAVPATVTSYTLTFPSAQGGSNQVLSNNGAGTLSWVTAGAGTVLNVTSANTDISVATSSTTPVLTLNSGTSANQIVKLNGSAELPAVSGANITSMSANNITAGTLSVARGGTGASTITSGGVVIGGGTGAVSTLDAVSANNLIYATGAGTWAVGTPTSASIVDLTGVQTISGGKEFSAYIQMNGQAPLRYADADSSNYVAFRAPATVTSNVNWTLPATDGSANQVLQTDGSGTLQWATVLAGTVNVSGGGTGITSGTSGGIPYFSSTTSMASSGVLTSYGVVFGGGAGIAPSSTAAGSANQVLRIPSGGGAPAFGAIELAQSAAVSGSLLPANGGTGLSTITSGSLMIGQGTANVSTLAATLAGNILYATGTATWASGSPTSAGLFMNGGNSFGGTATVGTNDAQSFAVETSNTTRITVDSNGATQFSGQAFSAITASSAASPLSWDANTSNLMRWTTNTASPTIQINNMKAGGAYMLTVSGTGTGSVAINCFSDAGVTSLPSGFVPANGSRVAGTLNKSVYTIMSDGQNCLVTWITGY